MKRSGVSLCYCPDCLKSFMWVSYYAGEILFRNQLKTITLVTPFLFFCPGQGDGYHRLPFLNIQVQESGGSFKWSCFLSSCFILQYCRGEWGCAPPYSLQFLLFSFLLFLPSHLMPCLISVQLTSEYSHLDVPPASLHILPTKMLCSGSGASLTHFQF